MGELQRVVFVGSEPARGVAAVDPGFLVMNQTTKQHVLRVEGDPHTDDLTEA